MCVGDHLPPNLASNACKSSSAATPTELWAMRSVCSSLPPSVQPRLPSLPPFSFHPQEALKRWHPGPFGTFRKDTTPRPPPSKHRPSELCGGETSKSQSMTFVDTRARNRTFCHEPSLAQPSHCAARSPLVAKEVEETATPVCASSRKSNTLNTALGSTDAGAHSSTSSLFALPVMGKATHLPVSNHHQVAPVALENALHIPLRRRDLWPALRHPYILHQGGASLGIPDTKTSVARSSSARTSTFMSLSLPLALTSEPDSRHTPANVLSVGTVVLRKSARNGECCSVPSQEVKSGSAFTRGVGDGESLKHQCPTCSWFYLEIRVLSGTQGRHHRTLGWSATRSEPGWWRTTG